MALKNYITGRDTVPFDCRCVRCRQGLDREGRYCRRCLRSQRLKLFFGSIAAVQLAVAGWLVLNSAKAAHFVRSAGSQTIAVANPNAQSGWVYYDVTDPLIEDVTHHARLLANSPVAPKGAPATPGATSGTLEVSYSRHYGTNVMLIFPPIAKACGANVCEVRAIFDDQRPVLLPYHDISTNSASVLTLDDGKGFLAALPRAHDLTIVASLGTDRDGVLTFGVAGFRMSMAALQQAIRAASAARVGAGPG